MPTCTDSIAHVHMPKTGGLSLAAALREHGGRLVGAVHSRAVDHKLGRRDVIGTIRDPWSWYVSLYLHCAYGDHRQQQALHDLAFAARSHPASDLEADCDQFEACIWAWTHSVGRRTRRDAPCVLIDLEEGAGAEWEAGGLGLFSFMARYFYGTPSAYKAGARQLWSADALADMAQADAVVAALLDEEGGCHHVNSFAARTRGHAPAYPAASRYTDEMLAWVSDADAALIDLLGCEPFGPCSEHLISL